jgi:hypothetical protein
MNGNGKNGLRHTTSVTAFFRSLWTQLLDPYRPELHYMRGPGPKWREKHGGAAAPVNLSMSLPAAA